MGFDLEGNSADQQREQVIDATTALSKAPSKARTGQNATPSTADSRPAYDDDRHRRDAAPDDQQKVLLHEGLALTAGPPELPQDVYVEPVPQQILYIDYICIYHNDIIML